MPVGFVRDAAGRVVLDPDKQVQETVRLLFQTYSQTGAAAATVRHFRRQGLLFPTRMVAGPRKGELTWAPLCLGRTANVLHNPWYAGAYAYGRGRWRKQLDGRMHHERLPQGEWLALIRDTHPGYISWEEHERIEQRLHAQAMVGAQRWRKPPREGPALLQGRAVCGLCGSRMHTHYTVRRSGQLIPDYVCTGRGQLFGDPLCQSIIGTEIDAAVSKLVVEAVTPMALGLALAVQQEVQSRLDEADRLRHRQVERAQYEADQARHRYMQVDPANRLVADSLEADWNARLRALDEAQQQYQSQRASDRRGLDDEERKRILALATDFPAAWRDPSTEQRDRKRMLALLVEDVTLVKQRQLTVAVRFRGGTTTTLTLPRPLTAPQQHATHPDVRRQIDELLDEYTDARVAHTLNERGLRTGCGATFTPVSLRWVRHSAKLKSFEERLKANGWITGRQMAANLGVSRRTVGKLRTQGRLKARICNDLGEWLYYPPREPPPLSNEPSETDRRDPTDSSTARGAV